jgi:peptidoglycan/LPS O-acetylase OafA/YrhL
MTLDGRVWQFLFGFLAHFVYKTKLLDWTNNKEGQLISYRLVIWIRNSMPVFLLVLLLTFPIINVMEQQIQRFLVIFLTALIIAIRQKNSILSWDTLVNLGDVSYSGKKHEVF